MANPRRPKPLVVIGFLGVTVDAFVSRRGSRWEGWRPTISIVQQEDRVVSRFELLHQGTTDRLRSQVMEDIRLVSPETEVRPTTLSIADPWDFEEVYGALHTFARSYPFKPDDEEYLVHITTGTHVIQICLFLLTESRHFPARLLQTSPPQRSEKLGRFVVIDLDLSRFDQIAARFSEEHREAQEALKSGIATRSAAFNRQI
ncbi:MAG TPA: RNA repair transcriptional activator RtcR family protein, partial [Planctomycetota bacterium]|nr:RNA repair transcriptional activator RtcR family protein [Planctomycetota bacterium]